MEKKKRRRRIVGIILILVIAGGITTAISMRGKGEQKQSTIKQSTISLSKMDLVKSISATGTIESKDTKIVSAPVKDIEIGKIKVSVGDTVKSGDTLVTFDKTDLQQALEEAQENLSEVQSDAEREVSSAQKQLNSAIEARDEEKSRQESKISEAKKEKNAAKNAVAKAKKRVSSAKNTQEKNTRKEELAKAQEALKQTKEAYENAVENKLSINKQNETSVENARSAVENASANRNKSVKEAYKQVNAAQDALKECSVKASIGGVVTAVYVEEGENYSGGNLLQIDDISSFIVNTSVDEYDISDVAVGQKVVILTEATDEEELEGEITFVAPSKQNSSESQSQEGGNTASSSDGYEVKIAIKKKDERLKLGMTAKCSIVQEEVKDVFAVPYDAVHEKSDGTYVIYVEDDSKAAGNSDVRDVEDRGTPPDIGDGENRGTPPDMEDGENRRTPPDMGDNKNFKIDDDENGDRESQGNSSQREIVVTKGMESDYYVEISGEDLYEGMKVIIPTDEVTTSSDEKESQRNSFDMFGNGGGGQNGMERGDRNGGPAGRER